jgi:hypothetical protein
MMSRHRRQLSRPEKKLTDSLDYSGGWDSKEISVCFPRYKKMEKVQMNRL